MYQQVSWICRIQLILLHLNISTSDYLISLKYFMAIIQKLNNLEYFFLKHKEVCQILHLPKFIFKIEPLTNNDYTDLNLRNRYLAFVNLVDKKIKRIFWEFETFASHKLPSINLNTIKIKHTFFKLKEFVFFKFK